MLEPHSTAHLMFNRKLTDMFEDLAASFPAVPEFSVAVSPPARMLLTLDPQHGQKMFNQYVALPYETHILDRDQTFLLSQTNFGPSSGVTGDAVNLIKRVWSEASGTDQDAIWRHLHVLVILNRRCIADSLASPRASVTDR